MRGFASRSENRRDMPTWLMGVILAFVFVGDAAGQMLPFTPLELAIAPNIQFPPADVPIRGFVFNAVYGIQDDVVGASIGVFNEQTKYLTGLSGGIVNIARGDAVGVQVGGANACEGRFEGIQVAVVNQVTGEIQGGQIAIANTLEKGTGFQIGVVNHAGSLKGIQFGLLNFNESGFLPFFPGINFGF